jgi:AcrR family transcriptional regulator
MSLLAPSDGPSSANRPDVAIHIPVSVLACWPLSKYLFRVAQTQERQSQAERRDRSEDALLDAAAELVAERGVQGASLASIGARAGVSRGLPTHYFGSKDVLVARLAERAQSRIGQEMREAQRSQAERVGELSALNEVFLTVDAYLEMFEDPTPDQRALLVMWGSTFPSSASVDGIADAERRSYEGLSQLIVMGQHDGSVRADVDPIATAVLLHGLMRGLAALRLTDSRLTDMRGVRSACHEWISSSLAPR